MKRIIDHYLLQWKINPTRQPLLLRGARQIGKTYAVRQLGKTYESFVEINLEFEEQAHFAFQGRLDPEEMLIKLIAASGKKIIPGKTLLFLDEIQVLPRAITALRYFYEMMPELHVIAAGSLLDFTIDQIGLPVGRVECLEMHPVSFVEYLAAMNKDLIIESILNHNPDKAIGQPMHTMYLEALGQYCAIGGMPKAIQYWIDFKNPINIAKIHASILKVYRQDFEKYARIHQIKYVEKIFDQIPEQLGQKFKYSLIEGEYRKRELAPALDLLIKARVAEKIYYSSGQGLPLRAQKNDLDYKTIFLDIGLAQISLGLEITPWFLNPLQEFINKGQFVEAFVGQELLAYTDPSAIQGLFYWHKEGKAEIDYLIVHDHKVIPIEVKSGKGNTLHSMHYFLEHHKESPYGIKFSIQDYSTLQDEHTKHTMYSYPLYAIFKVISQCDPIMLQAIKLLMK